MVTDLLEVLLAGGRRRDRLAHLHDQPASAGRTMEWPEWVPDDVRTGCAEIGIARPWGHQIEAAGAIWDSKHTVISTGTGSGKSLAFWLPVLSAAADPDADRNLGRIDIPRLAASEWNPHSTTLYLSPTKALAADQLHALQQLARACGIDLPASTCDGDSPGEQRRWARAQARVVLTNPDFLSRSLLPDHSRWIRLLSSLRLIVVDEAHSFRGVFGSHVALVLRRLLRLARHYGAQPIVVCASATIADPATSTARLIGCTRDGVVAVTESTAPHGRRRLALWEPEIIEDDGVDVVAALGADGGLGAGADPLLGNGGSLDDALTADDDPLVSPREVQRVSAVTEAGGLAADLALAGARSLVFTRSRVGAEAVAEIAREHIATDFPSLTAAVASYRGGYLPEERRALERRLRERQLRVLATTSALELGIDVSGLDAVVICGWPGTRMSLWQQAGRAGRGGSDGLAVLVAREDPLDQFVVHHPEAVIGTPVEAAVIDPSNPYVLAPHLCAAADELALSDADLESLVGADGDVEQAKQLLAVMEARGAVRRRHRTWHWVRPEAAASLVDLRGGGEGQTVQLIESATGRLLGTVDGDRADAVAHPGAVYVHQGQSFLVEDLDHDTAVALLKHAVVDYTTWARWSTAIKILSEKSTRMLPDAIEWSRGMVEVLSQVTGFQRRRKGSREVLDYVPLEMPERKLQTAGTWFTMPSAVLEEAGIEQRDIPGALHAAEHALIGILPLLATCDRWDLGGVSTAWHPDTGVATVFVHDAVAGGAGFSEHGYNHAESWVSMTLTQLRECPCLTGCPSCVQSPKCGNGNEPLDKAGAIAVLSTLDVSALPIA